MKKCTKPEMEIVMLDNKDILTESSCPDHTTCGEVSQECSDFTCSSVTCNLQGCPSDNCGGYDWPEE